MLFCYTGTEMVYLYPDLTTAIIGRFDQERHTLIKGKQANVVMTFIPTRNNKNTLCLHLLQPDETIAESHQSRKEYNLSIKEADINGVILVVQKDFWHDKRSLVSFGAPSSKCIR